ncbi:MAG: hypothetical protein LQ352_006849, partial [Teloschistes flavicans]
KKRNDPTTKPNVAYGSKSAPAGAQKQQAGNIQTGGIRQAIGQAQARFGNDQLGTLPEEDIDDDEPAGRLDQSVQQAIDDLERGGLMRDAQNQDGNQPSEDSSALQRQITLSDSDHSTDRSRGAIYLTTKHYVAIATFLALLALLFVDIYRGPLLGPRLDLFKGRHLNSNATFIGSGDISAIQERLSALEHQSNDFSILNDRLNAFESQLQDFSATLSSHKQWPVNYFSTRHVPPPAVEPHLTSPTWEGLRQCNPKRIMGILRLLWDPKGPACPGGEFSSSPSTVFGPWREDAGPSWCAAPGEGRLQITTILSAPMTPTEFIVEHPPSSSEILPQRIPAPKEFELWMAVRDHDVRESIGKAAEAVHGSFSTNEDTLADRALPPEFVPIGRWTYDYPSGSPRQIFRPRIDLKGTHTGTLVVRVNSNWAGNSYTCLYRLRVHGINRHPEAVSS